MKEQRKIKETALGQWLKAKAPTVLEAVGEALPDSGALGIVRNLLDKEDSTLADEAAAYMKLAEQDAEITKRWQADAAGDLSAKVRPFIVLGSCLGFFAFAILDGLHILVIRSAYIHLLESLLLTSVGGYFVLRSADKWRKPQA